MGRGFSSQHSPAPNSFGPGRPGLGPIPPYLEEGHAMPGLEARLIVPGRFGPFGTLPHPLFHLLEKGEKKLNNFQMIRINWYICGVSKIYLLSSSRLKTQVP